MKKRQIHARHELGTQHSVRKQFNITRTVRTLDTFRWLTLCHLTYITMIEHIAIDLQEQVLDLKIGSLLILRDQMVGSCSKMAADDASKAIKASQITRKKKAQDNAQGDAISS